MPTSFTSRHELPAGVAAAFALLTGPDWPAALDDDLRDGSVLLDRTVTPEGGVSVTVRRRLPDGVPSVLQRFLPADGTVTQTDVWGPEVAGARAGTWSAAFPGAPGSLGGSVRLDPDPSGAVWGVDGAVSIGIPLLGRRAESFLAPLLDQLIRRQADVLRSRLRAD